MKLKWTLNPSKTVQLEHQAQYKGRTIRRLITLGGGKVQKYYHYQGRVYHCLDDIIKIINSMITLSYTPGNDFDQERIALQLSKDELIEYVKNIQNDGKTVYLLHIPCPSPSDTATIVTQSTKFLQLVITIHSQNYDFSRVTLQEYASYEDAYNVALWFIDSNPLAFCQERIFPVVS